MAYSEAMPILIARPPRLVSMFMSPFVRLLSLSTDAIVRLIGIHQAKEEAPTEENIVGMIQEGAVTSGFEKTEYDIVTRAAPG